MTAVVCGAGITGGHNHNDRHGAEPVKGSSNYE